LAAMYPKLTGGFFSWQMLTQLSNKVE
jgi:hypothetical protein